MAPATRAAAVAAARRDYDPSESDAEAGMAVAVDLAGRKALVTGAARGIGRAIALVLGEAGADVRSTFAARGGGRGSGAGVARWAAARSRRLGSRAIDAAGLLFRCGYLRHSEQARRPGEGGLADRGIVAAAREPAPQSPCIDGSPPGELERRPPILGTISIRPSASGHCEHSG